jgi:hypothetical protein
MAIENISSAYGANLYNSQKAKVKEDEKKSSAFSDRTEKVEIKHHEKRDEISGLEKLVKNSPEIRIELVEELKNRIKTNDYPIKSRLDESLRMMIQDDRLFG